MRSCATPRTRSRVLAPLLCEESVSGPVSLQDEVQKFIAEGVRQSQNQGNNELGINYIYDFTSLRVYELLLHIVYIILLDFFCQIQTLKYKNSIVKVI